MAPQAWSQFGMESELVWTRWYIVTATSEWRIRSLSVFGSIFASRPAVAWGRAAVGSDAQVQAGGQVNPRWYVSRPEICR
jgi:hypothetical protein